MGEHYRLTSMDYISGNVISPHYRNAFLGVSGSSISKVAHGILIGQR
jgi:phosphatidylinositol glycan class Q protein